MVSRVGMKRAEQEGEGNVMDSRSWAGTTEGEKRVNRQGDFDAMKHRRTW